MFQPDADFWSRRRVLLTGHTGFKGSWLSCWLRDLGSPVHGVSLLQPPTNPSLWEALDLTDVGETRCDIATADWIDDALAFEPEVVLHLAAQPLVRVGYDAPGTTMRSNVLGTVRVMELLDRLPSLQAAVIVTTDKVYDARQPGPHLESSFLGGKDPYSASKAAAELVVHSWPSRHRRAATARAGNVIGGGDWAPDRLVPDLVKAWSEDREVVIRMPQAVRPWQHVVEPLAGYLAYVESIASGETAPQALNFGPDASQAVAVSDLVSFAADTWAELQGSRGRWRVESRPGLVETEVLTLDSSLARDTIGWRPHWDWREAIHRTLAWHASALDGGDALSAVRADISAYLDAGQAPARRDRET